MERPKRIGIGCDHAAYAAKERLKALLYERGYDVRDFGTHSEASVDYPDVAQSVAEAVATGELPRAVLMCGSGLGVCYTANRFPGVRGALCWSVEAAQLAREHNDANILILPGRVATMDPLADILEAWLDTSFSEDPRHVRRIEKIDAVGVRASTLGANETAN